MGLARNWKGWGRLLPPWLLTLAAGGCFSAADGVARFDRMLPPPGTEPEPGYTLLFEPLYLPNPWLLGLGSSRRRLEPCLLAMGEADDPPLLQAAALRLMLTLDRARSRYYRLLALASLGRIAARIGPGEPPRFPEEPGKPPPPPDLGPELRRRLAAGLPAAETALRRACREHLLRALHDPAEPVRTEAIRLFHRLWRHQGARWIFRLAQASRPFFLDNREGLRELVHACGTLEPAQARAGGREGSVFAHLERFTRVPRLVLGDPHLAALQMVAMHAICRILGEPPRYDPAFFRAWWERELAAWEEGAP